MLTRLLGSLLLACSVLAPSATAQPRIMYSCGFDLCSADASGSGARALTRDGTKADPYFGFSNVRDSNHVVYSRGEDAYRTDTSLRDPQPLPPFPGSLSTDARSFFYFFASPLEGSMTYGRVGREAKSRSGPERPYFAIWWKSRRFYGQVSHPSLGGDRRRGICLLRPDLTCRRVVADGPRLKAEFDVSADGRRLVASESPEKGIFPDGSAGLVLYDTATGERLRTLTSGHDDHSPTFSPDGSRIAFERIDDPNQVNDLRTTASVRVVSADGGRDRLVDTLGYGPVWAR